MTVVRWRFESINGSEDYTFEINPRVMSSPFGPKSITATATTAADGQVLVSQGARRPHEFTFSGAILTQSFYDALREWKDKNQRIYLYDHYGRKFEVVLTNFRPTPKRSLQHPWRHDYEMTALVLKEPPSA